MSLSLMTDIVLLAIFILIVFSCAHKGFVRTLMTLAALVAAFVLSNSASIALADPITERWAAPRMETFLTEKVSEYLPEDTLDTFIDMGDRALGMIQSMLSASDEDEAEETGVSRTEKDTKDKDANSLQQVAHTLAYALVRWLLFAILLALFYAILRALVENLAFIDRIPIVGTLDALLGVVLGIAIGLVVLFIPLIVTVNILPDILGGALEVPETFYKDSIVLNVLYTVYPFK